MSRYVIPVMAPAMSGIVGWDPPLQTFFAQITATPLGTEASLEEPYFYVWVGTSYAEVCCLAELEVAIRPFATLSQEMCEQLLQDQKVPYQHGPLQRILLDAGLCK